MDTAHSTRSEPAQVNWTKKCTETGKMLLIHDFSTLGGESKKIQSLRSFTAMFEGSLDFVRFYLKIQ